MGYETIALNNDKPHKEGFDCHLLWITIIYHVPDVSTRRI
jgi:hypothetical protein